MNLNHQNVVTNHGMFPISEIVNRFHDGFEAIKVLSWNEEKKVTEWDSINYTDLRKIRARDLIQIEGKSGFNLILSKWHPMRVLDNNRNVIIKRADELIPGDKLLSETTNMLKNKKSGLLSPEVAWLMGYFMGDGSMSQYMTRGKMVHTICFFDENKAILDRVNEILLKEGVIDRPHKIAARDKRSPNLLKLEFAGKRVFEYFLAHGFHPGRKALTVKLTPFIRANLTRDAAFSLMGGLVDSDGNIDSHDDIEFCTSSRELANDIMWMCHLLGIKSNYRIRNKFNHKGRKPSDNDGYYVKISHKYLYPLEKKFRMIKHTSGRYKNTRKNKFLNQFTLVTKVTNVDDKDAELYDLDTVKNHNYLAGTSRLVFM